MFKNLRTALETPEKSDKNLKLSPPPQREQASLERLDSNIMETPLIGIKLPRTLKHWREANTYFQLHRTSLPNVSDINNFTTSFQSLIYNYFASNYGTIKPQDLSTIQYPNKTVKNMKKNLKQLKLLGRNDHSFDMKISTLSKQIGTKLLLIKNTKTEKHVDITKQLKVKFWSTCTKLFNPSNSLTPPFSIDDYKKYFYNILHDQFHNKFCLPKWVPTLQQPTIPCNIDPPTYHHEIATAIRKCKLRASPCPLDQISIIVFKKCPMLPTIFHQLIIKCWREKLKSFKILGRNNNLFNNDIIAVSKVIRSKLHHSRRLDKSADQSEVSTQLWKNFWKACKKFSRPPQQHLHHSMLKKGAIISTEQ
ncbi:hypothetical protein HELRODRAFT_164997 [Helobdella robusta]|uniref:Reverse transcriptase domain-containing protein n=1 Tax=Helobdella robusta TaxID=6412 RepID=T1EW34_HELRO|nr:hypothetical protein HELRODRAFT_164997 [Helobdella robusta]ESN92864.1 hypothetical protein HELRODRAFT_164997 [Helobdella robusta]